MAWGKVDDKLYSSPKWMQVSKGGKALWVSALSWCMAQLTDGAVPKRTCSMLGASTQDARSLVEAGLWTETQDGYQFHDWLDYQPSREQVLNERKAAGERQRRARERAKESRKSHGVTNSVTHGEVHPLVTGDVTVPPTRPDPTPNTHDRFAEFADNGDENPSFAEFYSEYPRREARKKASTAFSKAIAGGADPQTIIAKAKIYAQAVKDHERKHIALPATWLNGERWDDEIELPPTGSEGGPSIWDRIQPRQNEG